MGLDVTKGVSDYTLLKYHVLQLLTVHIALWGRETTLKTVKRQFNVLLFLTHNYEFMKGKTISLVQV